MNIRSNTKYFHILSFIYPLCKEDNASLLEMYHFLVVVALSLSRVQLSCDPMDCSPPGSSVHGVSRQESWSGLPFPSPGDLPDPGIKPVSRNYRQILYQ